MKNKTAKTEKIYLDAALIFCKEAGLEPHQTLDNPVMHYMDGKLTSIEIDRTITKHEMIAANIRTRDLEIKALKQARVNSKFQLKKPLPF